jgi:MerR family transcriptional regulator, light-induced transcriptional regulator
MASVMGVDPWGTLRKLASVTKVRRKPQPIYGVSEAMVTAITLRLLEDQSSPIAEPAVSPASIDAEDVARFAATALDADTGELLVQIDRHLKRGLRVEDLFVHLLAPAARRLGEDWESDRLDFLEVTMGLWRLQEALRDVAARSPGRGGAAPSQRFALFAPIPGDQHGFGSAMVEECFARAGWSTELLIAPTRPDLLTAVGNSFCDLLALTVSCDCPIDKIHSLIVAVRSVSQNPNIVIMLGGRVLVADPGIAAAAGADGTAPTATDALIVAERLVDAQRAAAAI